MNLPGIYDIFQEKWKNYQTVHILSDTHFGEGDLENAYSFRPKAEDFVKLINSKVGRKDVIICLGDCGDLEYWKMIRGYKILLMGNHDDSHSLPAEAAEDLHDLLTGLGIQCTRRLITQ